MQPTRESLTETIGEIKDTVEQEFASAKQTVSGVLDYREQFKNEPLVWSLGALSAGFSSIAVVAAIVIDRVVGKKARERFDLLPRGYGRRMRQSELIGGPEPSLTVGLLSPG